jgi:hypothetical protein
MKDATNYDKCLDPFSNPVPTGKLRRVNFFSVTKKVARWYRKSTRTGRKSIREER